VLRAANSLRITSTLCRACSALVSSPATWTEPYAFDSASMRLGAVGGIVLFLVLSALCLGLACFFGFRAKTPLAHDAVSVGCRRVRSAFVAKAFSLSASYARSSAGERGVAGGCRSWPCLCVYRRWHLCTGLSCGPTSCAACSPVILQAGGGSWAEDCRRTSCVACFPKVQRSYAVGSSRGR